MEKLLKVSDVMDLCKVSRQTASRYMRQMIHTEKPLRVTESAIRAWKDARTVYPVVAIRQTRTAHREPTMIPYRKEV